LINGLGKAIYALRYRPGFAFIAFLVFSVIVYVPMHFVRRWRLVRDSMASRCRSRPAASSFIPAFFVGIGIGAMDLRSGIFAENGELAARWKSGWRWRWCSMARSCSGLCPPQLVDFKRAALWWRVGYGFAFALFSRAMAFADARLVPAVLRRRRCACSDAMRPSAIASSSRTTSSSSGSNYAVYDPPLSLCEGRDRVVGTLAGSWATVVLLRKIPVVDGLI